MGKWINSWNTKKESECEKLKEKWANNVKRESMFECLKECVCELTGNRGYYIKTMEFSMSRKEMAIASGLCC